MDAGLQAVLGAVVGVGALGIINKKITERLVKWIVALKGDLITLASVLVGWGLAFLFPAVDPTEAINAAVGSPIANLPDWGVRLITGVFIAMAAGYLTDREEARTGAVVVPGEGQVANGYDPGYVDGVRTPGPGEPGYNA